MGVYFNDRQLALMLSVLCTAGRSSSPEYNIKVAEKFLTWLDYREEPPDVTWVETGPVTDKIQDT